MEHRLTGSRPSAPAPVGRTRLFKDGFLYTSSGTESKSSRHSASLLLSLTDAGFEIEAAGQVQRARAVAVRPFAAKRLRACGVPFACVDASTNHPLYRAFAFLPEPGFLVLPPEAFSATASSLDVFNQGMMSARACRLLFQRLFDIAQELLPRPPLLDARIQRVIDLLEDDHSLGVAELATAVHLSRDRLSHLFTQEMGLPLRKYSQSLKIRAAARLLGSGLNFTQIAAAAGFTDSAHFSKIWSQAYGASPTFFYTSGRVSFYPPSAVRIEGSSGVSSRFRSRNAANSHDLMPTTKV
ncbi:helix-turn-helix domain-containing protein [Piscinibacter sp. HJYY11]|uniref:AraC family transcriptional regulator n=1 Tax=Piscinibacter sp. HJYY11 TaxID=2801333 RepID=UPI00191F16B6|nr:helix-turn-helix domain-containing protein [Piscinibacter sp. HJYY11]MBL0729180.1 helix-turn-helix domain-containing protein [Piscinibacter sp. HJYY11]